MKISLNWLCEYVDLKSFSVEDISHALTMVGFEVENIELLGLPLLENVVVGEILEFEQHPNADRLSVCQVRVDDAEPRNIVCGAKNFAKGDRVIVALPGAILPGGFEIKKSKLRGVPSEGMMCSERELGMGDDHDGIAILKDRPEIGLPLDSVFKDRDVIFDVEVTPNRPDALSHLGMAREMAAWFRKEMDYPEIRRNLDAVDSQKLIESVTSETPENCPHYRGYAIRGVTIGESPDWLKKRIKAIGLRPINNVVDITNFVLHETGQPLHAFDADLIRGRCILVRDAREGEKLVTLDDKERTLDSSMTVIADQERALVVAGVMGSIDAEVSEKTVNIFLEAAYFKPGSIRRTSRRLGLSTDSSYRFERGVDPCGAEYAALRCMDLILAIAGGERVGAPVVCGEAPLVEREIQLSVDYVRERLGFDVSDQDIREALEGLELDVREERDNENGVMLRVGIPSFRLDLHRPIDLVEEFLRIYGCEKIPEGRVHAVGVLEEDNPVPRYLRRASQLLVGRGFNEVMHYSLRSEKELRRWYDHTTASNLGLANPLASDASHLRPSLVPGLLDCIALNQSRGNNPRMFFETGRVFREWNGNVYEMVSVSLAVLETQRNSWKQRESTDFYGVSRLVLDLLQAAGIQLTEDVLLPIEGENPWQLGHAAELGSMRMGFLVRTGLLNPVMTREWNIEGMVYAGSLYFMPEFFKRPRKRKSYKPFSVFPAAIRDLAVITDHSTPSGKIRQALEKMGRKATGSEFNLESVQVFDVYQGQGVEEGKKSIACSLVFRSPERTLGEKEVNKAFDAIQKAVASSTDMELRS